jgi:hypothetical protein
MNWRNESPVTTKNFKDIKIGEVFEFDEIFYIKTTPAHGFDIINNITSPFDDFAIVILHNHEIIIL